MTYKDDAHVHHHEVAHLAYLNWQKDGSPHGHDRNYWLEAERQLKATKHLLASDLKPQATETPAAAKPKAKKARKSSASK